MIKVDESDPVGELDPSFPYRDVTIRRGVDVKEFYELEEEIGRGKFGTVYKCHEKKTGFVLAAKFVGIARRQDRKNVEREVEIMRALHHPRLIQLYDAFESQNVMCVVLEMIEGGELFERVIDDDFILTEKSCTVFMRQICEGVEFIHSKSIIHLDLKPENILCLTKTGNRIKIIDFGLARKHEPDKKLQVLFGTPEFVAPEVVNFDQISFATDMWSVGVICYVLLSGLSPFMGETDVQTMSNVTIAQYDFDDDSFEDISADAKDFISKLLVKDKEGRLTASQCLLHPWLRRKTPPPPPCLTASKENLRTFVDRYIPTPSISHSIVGLEVKPEARTVQQFIEKTKPGLEKQISLGPPELKRFPTPGLFKSDSSPVAFIGKAVPSPPITIPKSTFPVPEPPPNFKKFRGAELPEAPNKFREEKAVKMDPVIPKEYEPGQLIEKLRRADIPSIFVEEHSRLSDQTSEEGRGFQRNLTLPKIHGIVLGQTLDDEPKTEPFSPQVKLTGPRFSKPETITPDESAFIPKKQLKSTTPWFSEFHNPVFDSLSPPERVDRRASDLTCYLHDEETKEGVNLADEIRKLSARLCEMSNGQEPQADEYRNNSRRESLPCSSAQKRDPLSLFLANHGVTPSRRPKFKLTNLNRDVPLGSPPPPSNIAYHMSHIVDETTGTSSFTSNHEYVKYTHESSSIDSLASYFKTTTNIQKKLSPK